MDKLFAHVWIVEWNGYTLHMSNLIMLWAAMLVVLFLAYISTRNLAVVPSKGQFMGEGIYGFTRSMTFPMLGKDGDKYLFIIGSFFLLILTCNYMGQLPLKLIPLEGHKHFTAATVDLNVTMGLALVALVAYILASIKELGFMGFIKHHFEPMVFGIPIMFPFHVLDHIIRPATLALRLFANILVGEKLAEVAMMLSPMHLIGPVVIIFMELFVGTLQAYVFALLVTIYISLMTSHGDGHGDEAHAH